MPIRGLLAAAIALVLVGGGVWYSNRLEKAKEGKSSSPTDTPKIVSIPEDQFQQIELKKKDSPDLLIKRDAGGKWQIAAPQQLRADNEAVTGVVTSLSSLGSDRVIEDKAADLAPYGLNSPELAVTITKKDGKSAKVLIGDQTPTGNAYFAKLDGDPRVFSIASFNKTSVDKSMNDLRDKRLLTFDSDKLSRVELTAKKQTMEFGKNSQNEWQIVKPRPLRADNYQVEEIVRKLKDAKMDPSISPEDAKKSADAFNSGQVVAVAKATDAGGTQQLEVRKNKEDYYARSSVLDGSYKIAKDLGDGLDKGLDDLRNKKLFDFGFSDVTKLEVKSGDKTAAYQKAGEKWMMGPQEMDSTSVQAFVDKLRDMASIRFVDSGFTTPVFEVTVTSKDGKLVEKVLISRNKESVFARRENEPAIYEIDPKALDDAQKAFSDIKPAEQKKDGKDAKKDAKKK